MKRIYRPAIGMLSLLLLGGGTSVPGKVSAQGFFSLSEEEELELGKQVSIEVEKEQVILEDPYVTSYVDQLGQQLVQRSGRPGIPYHFKVVDSGDINAFALPGGYIYVNRGLIAAADNEAELAGVIGHEIGHVVGRHSAEQIKKLQLTGLGIGILGAILGQGKTGQIANIASQMVATGVFLKFSREAEREADQLGARNLYDAGYDPRAMVTFFQKLADMRQRQPSSVETFFSSHPDPNERAENVGDLIASLPRLSGLKTNSNAFELVKRRVDQLPPPRQTSEAAPGNTSGSDPRDEPAPVWRTASYRGQEEDYQIAARYAPLFQIGVTYDPRYDVPTRIDFDGDWDAANNTANAGSRSYRAPANVYFSLSETLTHIFLHYTLYFPVETAGSSRDRESHDLATALVVVEKDLNRQLGEGSVVVVESYRDGAVARYLPGAHLLGGYKAIEIRDGHPVLYVNPDGHVLSTFNDQEVRNDRNVREVWSYSYANREDEPANSRSRQIGYQLVNLYELWDLARRGGRETFGGDFDFGRVRHETVDDRGRHVSQSLDLGRVGATLRTEDRRREVHLPWVYQEADTQVGEWFFDPASRIKQHFNLNEEFPLHYVHQPFLEKTR